MALPVSWAMTNFCRGWLLRGLVVAKKTGAPKGRDLRSIAILRSPVRGTPSAPLGPNSALTLPGNSLKKTKRGLAFNISSTRLGLRFAHWEIPCIVASLRVISLRSNNHWAKDLNGWSFVPANPKRKTRPSSRRIFPEPWICIKAAATGSCTHANSWPFKAPELMSSARVGAGLGLAFRHAFG